MFNLNRNRNAHVIAQKLAEESLPVNFPRPHAMIESFDMRKIMGPRGANKKHIALDKITGQARSQAAYSRTSVLASCADA